MMRTIDNVTPDILKLALRMVGIKVDLEIADKIIDVIELIEQHGGETSIKDIAKLENKWKNET